MTRLGVREEYESYVASGTHPRAAGMYAAALTGRVPACKNTGDDFRRREHLRMTDMDEQQREKIVQLARQAGISTHGKTYNGALGKYTDPLAWVADPSDVKESAKRKGLSIDGMVQYTAPPKKKQPKPALATDIVDGFETIARSNDPGLDEKCRKSPNVRRELRDAIVEQHAPKAKKK